MGQLQRRLGKNSVLPRGFENEEKIKQEVKPKFKVQDYGIQIYENIPNDLPHPIEKEKLYYVQDVTIDEDGKGTIILLEVECDLELGGHSEED